MVSLHKIGLLIRHCGQTQTRVAAKLATQRRQHRALQESIDGLRAQCEAIDRLLQDRKLAGRVVDRAALFTLQQRQAVLRQQRYQLEFESDRLREEQAGVEREQEQTRGKMQSLQRRQRKFQHWADLQRRRRALRRLQREDLEIEDRIVWMK